FSCKYVALELQGEVSFYLIQHYIPSMLIVMISWLSFYLDLRSVPARIILGLLKVLTMTTKSSLLPKVSYIKAIDKWMTICLAFVCAAFVEYSMAIVLINKKDQMLKLLDSPAVKVFTGLNGEMKTI
ncbi:hypothetical protein CAPTEDRAFT_127634, partial [Capitella teleta]